MCVILNCAVQVMIDVIEWDLQIVANFAILNFVMMANQFINLSK
jgi:hypothetical protein